MTAGLLRSFEARDSHGPRVLGAISGFGRSALLLFRDTKRNDCGELLWFKFFLLYSDPDSLRLGAALRRLHKAYRVCPGRTPLVGQRRTLSPRLL